MAKKKQNTTSLSQEENALVQEQLAQYRQIAATLVSGQNPEQAEEAIKPITDLPEGVQVALLKALAKENTVEAADVLLAVNTYSALKEPRKEARRSLMRLETSRRYPQWTPPLAPIPVYEEPSSGPIRFWKGFYTDSRVTGQMQLMLFWEQGEDFKEVRTFGFLLEFWHDGIKDFFTEVSSKRQIERRIEDTRSQLGDIRLVTCDLAEGKRLVEEALRVNKQFGTRPHPDYTRSLPLIHRLLLDVDAEPGLDEDEESENALSPFRSPVPEGSAFLQQLMDLLLNPEEVVAGFLDRWLAGDYEAAYTVLADDSPLREGLSSDEWVAKRQEWAEQAHPSLGRSEIAYKLDEDEDDDEDENEDSSQESTAPQEVEAFWSLALTDGEAGSTPPELPRATAVYKATGRHWYWTKYTLVRQGNEWLISDMIDAGAEALRLPPEELQLQLTEVALLAAERLNIHEAEDDDEEDED